MKFRNLMVLMFVLSAVALISAACNNKLDLPTNANTVATGGAGALGPCGIPGPAFAGKFGTYEVPYSVAVSPQNGHVFVGEYSGGYGYVEEFTATGTFVNRWSSSSLYYPTGIAISPLTGNLYITDEDEGFLIFTPTGQKIFQSTSFTFGGNTYSDWYPHDIKLMANGNFIIADSDNELVEIVNPNGIVLQIFGGVGQPVIDPTTVAVNSNGNVYVWDTYSTDAMKEFNSVGTQLKQFSGSGSNCGQMYNAYGSIVSNGILYVSDDDEDWVNEFTPDGTFIGRFGGYPTHNAGSLSATNGMFYYPFGIAASADGTLYIVDIDDYRVQIFRP